MQNYTTVAIHHAPETSRTTTMIARIHATIFFTRRTTILTNTISHLR